MRKRRTLILLISILAVLASLLVLTDPWSTMGKNQKGLALKDESSVDRIVLTDAYDSTELIRADESWLLFGQEACNQTVVANLLVAASRLQISSVLSSGAPESHLGEPGKTRKITFYKGKREVLSFALSAVSGKYLLRPTGSDNAYYVSVSGYPDLNLNKVFSSTPNHYREHLLMDLLPSEISRISVQIPAKESFRFVQDSSGNIRLERQEDQGEYLELASNELAMRLLFSYFTGIRYESRLGVAASSLSHPEAGSLPLATLQVTSYSGDVYKLRVYPYIQSAGEEPHLFKALLVFNQEPEALLINYIYLDVLMRDLSHYLGDK